MDACVVRHLTKTFRMGVGRARVREMLPWPIDRAVSRAVPRWWARNTFNALEDVSLKILAGSSVGIVGHNGAGKTTLLKVIAGVTSPSVGSVEVSGRVGALIDVLVGFHPELTGRENIYLLGAVHGFRRREIAPRVDQILEFAEIKELTDTPLKRFSAGMTARLGFATLTALDMEVLLIDEVLAVGDAAFQRKCIQWLDGYRSSGGTLVFVSHNLGLVRSMTDRTVWLDRGRIVADGVTPEVLARYARAMERREVGSGTGGKGKTKKLMRERGLHRWGAGGVRVEEVNIDDRSVKGDGLDVTIRYSADGLPSGVFCVGFVDENERELGGASSGKVRLDNGAGQIRCRIHPLPLRSGIYFPVVAVLAPDGRVCDRWRLDRAVVVEPDVGNELGMLGPVSFHGSWSER